MLHIGLQRFRKGQAPGAEGEDHAPDKGAEGEHDQQRVAWSQRRVEEDDIGNVQVHRDDLLLVGELEGRVAEPRHHVVVCEQMLLAPELANAAARQSVCFGDDELAIWIVLARIGAGGRVARGRELMSAPQLIVRELMAAYSVHCAAGHGHVKVRPEHEHPVRADKRQRA